MVQTRLGAARFCSGPCFFFFPSVLFCPELPLQSDVPRRLFDLSCLPHSYPICKKVLQMQPGHVLPNSPRTYPASFNPFVRPRPGLRQPNALSKEPNQASEQRNCYSVIKSLSCGACHPRVPNLQAGVIRWTAHYSNSDAVGSFRIRFHFESDDQDCRVALNGRLSR